MTMGSSSDMGSSTEGRKAGLSDLGEFIHQIFNILLGFNLRNFYSP